MNPTAAFRRFRQALAPAALLLTTVGTLELHDTANHHRELSAGTLLASAASHPGAPQHFESCEPTREHGCAACSLTSNGRGVKPRGSHILASSPAGATSPPPAAPSLASPQLCSASPRGPPAA